MKIVYGRAALGVRVAKDFGEDGLFFGEVHGFDDEPDEDGEDVDGGVYEILFTDGDVEDWEEDQYTEGVGLARLKGRKSPKGCNTRKQNEPGDAGRAAPSCPGRGDG